MDVAFNVLGWTPETFWRATPNEFWAAYNGRLERLAARRAAAGPPTRAELDDMMRRFPDQAG